MDPNRFSWLQYCISCRLNNYNFINVLTIPVSNMKLSIPLENLILCFTISKKSTLSNCLGLNYFIFS